MNLDGVAQPKMRIERFVAPVTAQGPRRGQRACIIRIPEAPVGFCQPRTGGLSGVVASPLITTGSKRSNRYRLHHGRESAIGRRVPPWSE